MHSDQDRQFSSYDWQDFPTIGSPARAGAAIATTTPLPRGSFNYSSASVSAARRIPTAKLCGETSSLTSSPSTTRSVAMVTATDCLRQDSKSSFPRGYRVSDEPGRFSERGRTRNRVVTANVPPTIEQRGRSVLRNILQSMCRVRTHGPCRGGIS